jgi:hypothetical protein
MRRHKSYRGPVEISDGYSTIMHPLKDTDPSDQTPSVVLWCQASYRVPTPPDGAACLRRWKIIHEPCTPSNGVRGVFKLWIGDVLSCELGSSSTRGAHELFFDLIGSKSRLRTSKFALTLSVV